MKTKAPDTAGPAGMLRNIEKTLDSRAEDILDLRPGPSGMMNRAWLFRVGEQEYLYRHPGPGTNEMVDRRHEKQSLRLAAELGVDPTCIYADGEEGWKISRYIAGARPPEYTSPEDSSRILAVLRRLHASPVRPDYGLRPWEDGLELEAQIRREAPETFLPWAELKAQIAALAEKTRGDGVEPCFCHGDCYRPNWLLLPDGGTILIDWEYAGCSDPGIDLGYYIIDGGLDAEAAEALIREYLGEACTEARLFHFLAYAAITGYYWCLWALLRTIRGVDNGDAADRWEKNTRRFAALLSRNRK